MDNPRYLVLSHTGVQYEEFIKRHGLAPFVWKRLYDESSWRGYDPASASLVVLPDGQLRYDTTNDLFNYWIARKGRIVLITEEQARGIHSLFHGLP